MLNRRILSPLLALAMAVGLLAVSASAAVTVKENPWLGYSNDPLRVDTYTNSYGWKENLYVFPSGTTFYVGGGMAEWTALTVYDPAVVGDITFGSNCVFYSETEHFSPEPGKVYHMVVSDTMQGFDAYVMVDGSASAGTEEPETPVEQPSKWAAEPVNSAISLGVVPETLQEKYTQAATRAEFCALAGGLYETADGGEITQRATFTDTTDENVEKMAALGVVNGMGDGTFNPDRALTRQEAATMLARLAEAMGKPLITQASTFADTDTISSWARTAVGQVQATNIMNGMGNNLFAPHGEYTREQSIVTIMRLYDAVK